MRGVDARYVTYFVQVARAAKALRTSAQALFSLPPPRSRSFVS
jgi:hypothetical protein